MKKQTSFDLWYALVALFSIHKTDRLMQIARIPNREFQQLCQRARSPKAAYRKLYTRLAEASPARRTAPIHNNSRRSDAWELADANFEFIGQTESNFLGNVLSWAMPIILFFGV